MPTAEYRVTIRFFALDLSAGFPVLGKPSIQSRFSPYVTWCSLFLFASQGFCKCHNGIAQHKAFLITDHLRYIREIYLCLMHPQHRTSLELLEHPQNANTATKSRYKASSYQRAGESKRDRDTSQRCLPQPIRTDNSHRPRRGITT